MDTKDQVAAANALIEWFNSQEIGPSDAQKIMSKVLAKLLAPPRGPHLPREALQKRLDTFTLNLAHDVNERTYSNKWK